jgi:hypothetical protein
MEPLKIKTTIEIIQPVLQIEYVRNDSLFFEIGMGDLINGLEVSVDASQCFVLLYTILIGFRF